MSDTFTIDDAVLEAACPRCAFYNPFSIRQARLRDVIICRGCKSNIQLDDHMNEVRKAERATREAMAELVESFQSLSRKLTIEI